MLHGVAALIAFCSRFFTLEPGDVIATGTPAGVGVFRKPPRFLADGDEVVIEHRVDRLADQPLSHPPGLTALPSAHARHPHRPGHRPHRRRRVARAQDAAEAGRSARPGVKEAKAGAAATQEEIQARTHLLDGRHRLDALSPR